MARAGSGLPPPKDKIVKHVSGDPGFKAALLKAQFDLPLDDYPTFNQALDALATMEAAGIDGRAGCEV